MTRFASLLLLLTLLITTAATAMTGPYVEGGLQATRITDETSFFYDSPGDLHALRGVPQVQLGYAWDLDESLKPTYFDFSLGLFPLNLRAGHAFSSPSSRVFWLAKLGYGKSVSELMGFDVHLLFLDDSGLNRFAGFGIGAGLIYQWQDHLSYTANIELIGGGNTCISNYRLGVRYQL